MPYFSRIFIRKKKFFRQEGWHYELENAEAPLKLNGVVYNEMKGAFSSPEEVLDREVFKLSVSRYYLMVWKSGGDPNVIPELSYSEFLEFHKTLLSSGQQLYLPVWKYGYGRTFKLDGRTLSFQI